jgi:uncharacterized protein (DUF302 family)
MITPEPHHLPGDNHVSQDIGFELEMSEGHDAAVEKVTEALKTEGFGVLTSIDVRATLQEKIGEDFRPFTILGACNPHLAHRALSENPTVGLMLPCNVTVEASGTGSLVRFINPESMLSTFTGDGNDAIQALARDASERLLRVRSTLQS